MRVLRAAEYRRMPWKNGGGETIEMLASPAGASLEAFDWRISMAHVGESGPFSAFPDVDRTLTVIAGTGIRLGSPEGTLAAIHRDSPPFSFSGDLKVDGVLIEGPIDDLNVMTRRSRFHHCVSRHLVSSPAELQWQGDTGIVIAITAGIDIEASGNSVALSPMDAVEFDARDARNFTVSPAGDAEFLLVEIRAGPAVAKLLQQ